MNKTLMISRKIIAIIAIVVGFIYLVIYFPVITGIVAIMHMKSLVGKIFILLFTLRILRPIFLLVSGIMLAEKYTIKIFKYIYIGLGLIALGYVEPLLGIAEFVKGYYTKEFYYNLPIIVVNLALLVICYVYKNQEKVKSPVIS